MPDHARKQIRDAVVTAVTGLTTTGANVYPTRMHRVTASMLPCLLVYTLEEESEPDNISRPRGLDRESDIAIEAVAEDNDTLDDTLDTMSKEVEAVLGNNLLGGLVKDLFLAATEVVLNDAAANKKLGAVRMTWRCKYRTPENDATVLTT